MKHTIVCGFAGIGKSYLAKSAIGVVDLESTPFEKDWARYAKVAKHMSDSGYTVLLSCHKELREELRKNGIRYVFARPWKDEKEKYIERYKERGNTPEFIAMFEKNWDSFLEHLDGEEFINIDKYLTLYDLL